MVYYGCRSVPLHHSSHRVFEELMQHMVEMARNIRYAFSNVSPHDDFRSDPVLCLTYLRSVCNRALCFFSRTNSFPENTYESWGWLVHRYMLRKQHSYTNTRQEEAIQEVLEKWALAHLFIPHLLLQHQNSLRHRWNYGTVPLENFLEAFRELVFLGWCLWHSHADKVVKRTLVPLLNLSNGGELGKTVWHFLELIDASSQSNWKLRMKHLSVLNERPFHVARAAYFHHLR
mmetsp:Transcript_42026/g.68241  ORF Transcript_42026/g.68241 Transcript_42026/m.68241 type:complete len:231 (-) Transcript_42026:156-848(-)